MQVALYGLHGRGVETAARIICSACAKSGINVKALVTSDSYKKALIKIDGTHEKDFSLSEISVFFDILNEKLPEKSLVIYNSPTAVSNTMLKKNMVKSHYVDAFSISQKPNMVMLGAFSKMQTKISAKSLKSAIEPYGKEALEQFDEGCKKVK